MAPPRADSRYRPEAERLADIITALQRSFILRLSQDLARGNVSFPQYLLLGFLSQQKRLTMSEIAQRMGHTTAAATGLVDRLEKLGLVRRLHAREDRRKVFVQATVAGQALVSEVRDDMVCNLLALMENLEHGEQAAWLRIYEKVFNYCQEKCPVLHPSSSP
ncbi:MAG: MarR family transcriptional regulator [Chthoniobacteraceae bacterium]